MTPSVFLFDLDGTLVNTAPDLAAAANALRIVRGLTPIPYETLGPLTGRGVAKLVEAALGVQTDDPAYPALRLEFLQNYEAALAVHSTVFPGIFTLLEALGEAGVRVACVTNKQTSYALDILTALGLMPFLSLVIGYDSPNAALKPKPDSILAAMRALGADPARTWFVGDDINDVTAAHAAGIPCAFADWSVSRTKATESGADFIAKRPETLFGWYLRTNADASDATA